MALSITQLFAPTVLTAGASVLYTMPTLPATNVLKNGRMRFLNTNSVAVTVTAYTVPSGGSPAAGNEFVAAQSIGAGQYLDTDIPVIKSGDTIQALAGAVTSITASQLDGVLFS